MSTEDALDDVPEDLKPRKYHAWASVWVLWGDGADEGGYFIGFCPICDPQRQREASAEFNFLKGVFRCSSKCCHPNKNVMSITLLADRMLGGSGE